MLYPGLYLDVTNINYNESIMLIIGGSSLTSDFNYDISGQNCIIVNGILIGKKAGISKIVINKKGDNNFNNSSKEITVKVNKILQGEILIKDINNY